MLDFAAIPQSARFFDTAKHRVHHFDPLIALGNLSLQFTKRALEILDAGADIFMLFDQLVITRKLALGPRDATLYLGRLLVNQIDSVAQAFRAVSVFFNFKQL